MISYSEGNFAFELIELARLKINILFRVVFSPLEHQPEQLLDFMAILLI